MKFFSIDSPLYNAVNSLVTMIYIGLLWFLFSIPIVTIGASTTALYEVMYDVIKKKEGYIFSSFWKAFRKNLKQGSILGIIVLVAEGVCGFNFFVYMLQQSSQFLVQKIIFAVLLFLVNIVLLWVFPVKAKFENTIPGHLHTAFFIGLRKMGWTVALMVVQAIAVFCVIFFMYMPLLFIMGIVGYIQAVICDHILERMIESGQITAADSPVENEEVTKEEESAFIAEELKSEEEIGD